MNLADTQVQKSRHWQALLLSLGLAAIVFLPFIIIDRGFFLYFGDFNVQQIPFYKLAHEAVRAGELGWNWYTDLGANFVGSYSFYLLTSPFFWLTIPFPTSFVPHLMAPLLIFKTGCAGLTSYFFIARFVRDKRWAVLGSLLYSFSGFLVYNVFFNHFHEVVVFFPLLLIGLEELMQNNRRGVFAIAVAVNCLINYWFFIGEAVFLILYFMVRLLHNEWEVDIKAFLTAIGEAVLGVLCAMVILFPSVLTILGNPRTTSDNLLTGWNFWIYWNDQRQSAIFGSLFFPPDLPSRPNLFPDHDAKWASMTAWLPLFGTSGVIAYLSAKKKNWLSRILIICLAIALVPGLNSMFVLFNHSYYARWYYMPILLMCVATAVSLEDVRIHFNTGFKWSVAITAALTAVIGLTPRKDGDDTIIGLSAYPERFWAWVAIVALGFALIYVVRKAYLHRENYIRMLTVALSFVCVAYSVTFIAMGKAHSDSRDFIIDTAIKGRYQLDLPDEGFARSDVYDDMDNLGMFWHLPNIQAFHSIIPNSIMEFYPKVGVKRDVSSKPETKLYPLRALLSVRWLFIEENKERQDPMPGFALYDNQIGYNIYENQNYIPMGFAYDYFIGEEELEDTAKDTRSRLMVKALYLEEEAIRRNVDILNRLPEYEMMELSDGDFVQDAADRRAQSASVFEIDRKGFTAQITLNRDNLVFFSVPYDKGWKATVNGEPTQIEKANIGFMAVRAPEGESKIRFTYRAPGLLSGGIISAAGVAVLAGYLLLSRRKREDEPVRSGIYGLDLTPLSESAGTLISKYSALCALQEEYGKGNADEDAKEPETE